MAAPPQIATDAERVAHWPDVLTLARHAVTPDGSHAAQLSAAQSSAHPMERRHVDETNDAAHA